MPLPSVSPFANTSTRGEPLRSVQATAVGAELRTVPSTRVQDAGHEVTYVFWYSARSVPRTNTCMRLLVEVAAGIWPQWLLYRLSQVWLLAVAFSRPLKRGRTRSEPA